MKQTLEYQRDEHHVHLIVYHLIWCPRRRKPVLVDKIAQRCQQLIEQKCQEKGWQILTLAIQPDHLHLCVRCFPSNSASEVVKECKGITSFFLRAEVVLQSGVQTLGDEAQGWETPSLQWQGQCAPGAGLAVGTTQDSGDPLDRHAV